MIGPHSTGDCLDDSVYYKDRIEMAKDFVILEEISSSGYSIVAKARTHPLSPACAVKIIPALDRSGIDTTSLIAHEIEISKRLAHPSIIRFFGCRTYSQTVCLIFELASTDLSQLVQQSLIPEAFAKQYVLEIAYALDYIHAKGIIHRDLTLNNILITLDGRIKIADFATALDTHSNSAKDDLVYEDCGSQETKAPEMVTHNEHSRAGDYWSLGVILYQLVTGEDPFKACGDKSLPDDIVNSPLRIPPYISPQCCEVLHRLLEKNPNARICSFQDLSSCAFFNGVALRF